MVSSLSIIFMVFSFLVSVLLPIVGVIFLKRKYNVSLKVFFIGAAAFLFLYKSWKLQYIHIF